MKKLLLPILLVVFILFAGFLFASNTLAQSSADCLKQYHNSQAKCSDAARACIDGCPGAQGVDLGPLRECLRSCDSQKDSCIKAAEAAYDACIKGGQPPATPESSATQPSAEPWMSIQFKEKEGLEKRAQEVNDWIKNTFGDIQIEKIETGSQIQRPPAITKEDEQFEVEVPKDKFYLNMAQTTGLIKFPGSQEFKKLKDFWHIPQGSTIKAVNETIKITTSDEKVILISPGSEVFLTSTREIHILKGNIEVKKNNPSKDSEKKESASTEFLDLIVIGTHYWITHDPGKQTEVGVYEGEVEVKTKNGKIINLLPDGDKPGVVVVSQKLSPVKLALAGLVLAVVIGGVVLLLKRLVNLPAKRKR